MNELTSLRFRLAVTGFIASYAPLLFFLIVTLLLTRSVETTRQTDKLPDSLIDQVHTVETTQILPLWVLLAVTIGAAPLAAVFAWWWSGKALQPAIDATALQEQLLEETSHDLRTPLSVLLNNAQVLLIHPAPTLDIYRQGIERTGLLATQMTQMLETLLVDARGRTRTIIQQAVDVHKLSQDVVIALRPLATKHQIAVRLSGSEPVRAKVDAPSVSRAITNLVKNAIQHAPPDSIVHLNVGPSNDFVQILVTDSGPGIPSTNHKKIFDRYWQADAADGSGIGLAIVEQVALAHGGSISVDSPVEDDQGTRFRLTLKK